MYIRSTTATMMPTTATHTHTHTHNKNVKECTSEYTSNRHFNDRTDIQNSIRWCREWKGATRWRREEAARTEGTLVIINRS